MSIGEDLIELARELGSPIRPLAILAEGNVSAKVNEASFLVKASGMPMGTATAESFVEVAFGPILEGLSLSELSDPEVRERLSTSLCDRSETRRPSVETFMHAYLLGLPGVEFVGHTHPTPLLSLLCLRDAESIAKQRLFPDEIVCCGPETPFVPYVDPGVELARAIRTSVETYIGKWGDLPKCIWLQNHGLICLGKRTADVLNSTLMSVKAAQVWTGAIAMGRELNPLSQAQVSRIHTRPDEHYRQRLLAKMALSPSPA